MTQALKTLLNNSVEFRTILGKAQTLHALQQRFTAVAPANLTSTCQVLSLEFGILTISTGNAIVAAKLRQLAPQIVADMKIGESQVSGIRVKVQVSYPQPESRKARRQLSLKAQGALHSLTKELADSPLKDALNRMIEKKSA